jgi:acyl carrier protein
LNDDVENRVSSVLADVFGISETSVGPHTSTETVEGWDSLQHLTVILSLEEEFDIHLDEEEVLEVVAFPAICEVVRRNLSASEQA